MASHKITLRAMPGRYMALCTCGWAHTETRRQNALARAAKVRAAIRRHMALVTATAQIEET